MSRALTMPQVSNTHLMIGTSAVALAAMSAIPVGNENALMWLVDLCLPDGAAPPDVAPIAMEHKSHFAAKGAGVLALASAGMIFFGMRYKKADPDKVLAMMAYMANATPGFTRRDLKDLVERETGFVLSNEDAADALTAYCGRPTKADLHWIAEGTQPRVARAMISAALKVGWKRQKFSAEALKIVGVFARALGLTGDDLSGLLPKPTADTKYDLFPAFDSVSHRIGYVLDAFSFKRTPKGVFS